VAREKLSIPQLEIKANDVRRDVVHMLELAKSGHPGGALGLADIVTALYFNIMNIDPRQQIVGCFLEINLFAHPVLVSI